MKVKKSSIRIGSCPILWKLDGSMWAMPDIRSIGLYDLQTGSILALSYQIALHIWRTQSRIPADESYKTTIVYIFAYLRKLIATIISAPNGFNDYVAENLSYQQRDGRIARKEFNRVEPRFKIEVEDRETAIKALEDSVNGISTTLF